VNPAQIVFFVLGLIVGSFLNVCVYRLPRSTSIVSPPSACPRCNSPVKPWDNIPVISFLLLGGKCRNCGETISFRYPLIELLNGFLYCAVAASFEQGWHLLPICALVSSLIVITFIDLDFQIIPDVITLPGIVIGLLAASFILPDPFSHSHDYIVGFKNSLIGLLTGGGLFFLIAFLSKGGMGGGDIKLMAMIGAFMGWKAIFLTTFIGSVTGSLAGIFLMIAKGRGRKSKIPFGPFLALGAVITLFFGNVIMDWYLKRG
jgi:leader peptidase (prepilin peptidase)/N-methyltransferase